MLCVQWHPERIKDKEANPFSENLKEQFLAAIRKTNMKKLIINPATEEVIAELNEDTKKRLQKKFELLRTAQPGWSKVPLSEQSTHTKKIFCFAGRKY